MRATAKADAAAGSNEAHAFRIMDATAIRNGAPDDTVHVGLTSLKAEHVTVKGDTTHLQFIGKSGVAWHAAVPDAGFARHMKSRLASTPSGKPIMGTTNDKLNAYIKKASGGREYTAKDFRTHHATESAKLSVKSALAKLGNPHPSTLNSDVRKAIVKDAVTAGAQRIHDTVGVAKSTYINPALFAPFE
jgi:DNA topoisomerase-1